MVIVEFFDRTPIENMISSLANSPEKVIFVGNKKIMIKQDETFRRFLRSINKEEIKLEYRHVQVHALHEIVKVLEEIVHDNPGCHIDLTGGDDLSMVAAGVLYERYREQGVELHQYNIRARKVYDCDLDGEVVSGDIPTLTVEQNIILHGGDIVSSDQRESGTYEWDMSEEFQRDIEAMWKLCIKSPKRWNAQTTLLGEMDDEEQSGHTGENQLVLKFDIKKENEKLEKIGHSFYPRKTQNYFRILEKQGIISDLGVDDNRYFHLTFKNEQIRRVMTKAGTILELKVYMIAKSAKNEKGKPFYNDVRTGVFIDWDGVIHEEWEKEVDTENEIDLILMKGLIPVFVSCKNGAVGEDELYKLNTVAERFGGAYAEKILICTMLDKKNRSMRYFEERAKAMKIRIIKNLHKQTDEDILKRLK
jgi:hypothetical protein